MGLRILGAVVAVLLVGFAVARYRRDQLRRGELLAIGFVAAGLGVAALAPALLDPILRSLGFEPGNERRIIGLLVLSNLFSLALVFRGFSRDDLLSNEIGELVDGLAAGRVDEEDLKRLEGACAVVLPAYNEAENLPFVLGHMPRELHGLPVVPIVIADGCTDSTEPVARRLGAIAVRRDLRRGSGAAVRLGYKVALKGRARVIATIDADGQHDPRELDRIVAPLIAGEAEMVQGSRALGSFEVESTVRALGVRIFARLLTTLGRTKITDPSTGYRAMTAETIRKLDLRQDQFYVSEIILDAARKGVRVVEVPITLRARASGTTKKPATLRYAWGFSKAIVRTWLR